MAFGKRSPQHVFNHLTERTPPLSGNLFAFCKREFSMVVVVLMKHKSRFN
jgi:hypothetical protein